MTPETTAALRGTGDRDAVRQRYGEDEANTFAKLITLALPRQRPPGGGANLWTTDGSTGNCGPRS